jgi:hypothetical protein
MKKSLKQVIETDLKYYDRATIISLINFLLDCSKFNNLNEIINYYIEKEDNEMQIKLNNIRIEAIINQIENSRKKSISKIHYKNLVFYRFKDRIDVYINGDSID